jgi:mannose-P-dolichol utilization defect protein 1
MFIYDLFEKFMLFFFSSKCYDDVILNLNLTNFACLKLALSKCLGYGVVAGSLMVRVPQILVIFGSSSAEGISFISEVLLMIAITGTMGYGFYKDFPISTYGDSYALYVQG